MVVIAVLIKNELFNKILNYVSTTLKDTNVNLNNFNSKKTHDKQFARFKFKSGKIN